MEHCILHTIHPTLIARCLVRFQALAGAKKLFNQIVTSSGETVDTAQVMALMKEIGYKEGNQSRELMIEIMKKSENQSLASSARRNNFKAEVCPLSSPIRHEGCRWPGAR
jgi:hypothetical protein